MKQIQMAGPWITDLEKETVAGMMDNGWDNYDYVENFEQAFAEWHNRKYCLMTPCCTHAIHLLLLSLDIKEGDEVIVPECTWTATAAPVTYLKATPVFADIDPNNWCLDPASVRKNITKKTKAIIVVDLFGNMPDMEALEAISKEYNIPLVEDAAESLGSFYDGNHTGRFGTLAAISFNGNKIITTGGGGMVITDDKKVAERLKHITTTAKKPHPWLYIHDELGFNYRLPNLNAALGCAQMEVLPDYIERKRALAGRYNEWLTEQGYKFILEPDKSRSNYWINSFLTNDRDERDFILEYTNHNKVMTRPAWTPIHSLDMYS